MISGFLGAILGRCIGYGRVWMSAVTLANAKVPAALIHTRPHQDRGDDQHSGGPVHGGRAPALTLRRGEGGFEVLADDGVPTAWPTLVDITECSAIVGAQGAAFLGETATEVDMSFGPRDMERTRGMNGAWLGAERDGRLGACVQISCGLLACWWSWRYWCRYGCGDRSSGI